MTMKPGNETRGTLGLTLGKTWMTMKPGNETSLRVKLSTYVGKGNTGMKHRNEMGTWE